MEMSLVLTELLEYSARLLKPGGRLVDHHCPRLFDALAERSS